MNGKNDSLQVIRTMAFLGVFLAHSGIALFAPGGAWGVSVFFVLSGFLMVYSYYGKDRVTGAKPFYCIRFGIGKVKKLYSLHIITMLLALPSLVLSYWNYCGVWKVIHPSVKIAVNALLLQSWVPDSSFYFSLNAVSWYLSAALFLYIMFPVVLSVIDRYKGIKNAIAAIGFVFATQILLAFLSWILQEKGVCGDDFVHWFVSVLPLSRLEDFVIGCNLGYIFLKRSGAESNEKGCSNTSHHSIFTLLEIVVLFIIISQWLIYAIMINIPAVNDPSIDPNKWWGLTIMWTLSSCFLVYLFALKKGKLSISLSHNRMLLFIAELSAYCYLIHQMVYRYLEKAEQLLFGKTLVVYNVFICFGVTILGAYIWKIMNQVLKKHDRNRKEPSINEGTGIG